MSCSTARSWSCTTGSWRNPGHLVAKVRFVTLYHLVLESTLGLTTFKFVTDYLNAEGLLPGFVEGYSKIHHDETRHIGYGVWFLRETVRQLQGRGLGREACSPRSRAGKLSQASVKQRGSAGHRGRGLGRMADVLPADETADFVGVQRIVGRIGGRSGSFVLFQTAGTFDGKEAKGRLSVVPGLRPVTPRVYAVAASSAPRAVAIRR